MKRSTVILGLLAAVAAGQLLVQSVVLPDSLSATTACDIAHVPRNNTVVVAGPAVVVLDGASLEPLARLPVGARELLYARACDKVYARDNERVVAIDAASRSVLDTLEVDAVDAMSYDELLGRVYIATRDDRLLAFDCSADTLVAGIQLPWDISAVCCAPAAGKVYCTFLDTTLVAVVDCVGDSLLGTFAGGIGARTMLYSAHNNRLYIGYGTDEFVAVVDCANDSVVGRIATVFEPAGFCADPRDNKVYVADNAGDLLTVIDGAGDSLLRRISVPRWPCALAWDSTDNLVYVASRGERSLTVVDAARDTVIGSFAAAGRPQRLLYDGAGNKVYLASESSGVTVVPGGAIEPAVERRLWVDVRGVAPRPAADELYCQLFGQAIAVLGADSFEVRRQFGVAADWLMPSWDRAGQKLYAGLRLDYPAESLLMQVHADRSDSVVRIAGVSGVGRGLVLDETRGRAWYASTVGVFEVDMTNATLVRQLWQGFTHGIELAPALQLVFAAVSDGIRAFDAETGGEIWAAPMALTNSCPLVYVPVARLLCVLGPAQAPVLDAETGLVRGTLDMGPVSGHSLSADQSRLYLAQTSASRVVTIDLDSMALSARVTVERPKWMLADTTRGRAYCGSDDGTSVTVLDLYHDRVVGVVATGATQSPAWDQSLRRLYLTQPGFSSLLVVTDTTSIGVAEGRPTPNASRSTPAATLIRGVLNLPSSPAPRPSSLLDASGRRVLSLKPGPNDVSALSPGVYFVHSSLGIRHSSFTKVVLTR